VVRELTKAEQARGARLGTPGSIHARHSTKPAKQYGPGFFGSRRWKWSFILGTLLCVVAFVGLVVYERTRPEEPGHHEETEAPGTEGSSEADSALDGASVSPSDIAVPRVA